MPVLALALMLAATPEAASPEALKRLAPAFSGTIVSTYDDGRKGKLNLAKDGTYRYRGRSNKESGGVWDLKGADTICLHQKRPVPIGSYCTAIPKGKTWTAKAQGGERITLRVVSGRG